MSTAFDRNTADRYLDIAEVQETGHVTLHLVDDEDNGHLSIDLDAEDLARALLTASPTFVTAISEVAQRAILQFVEDSGNTE